MTCAQCRYFDPNSALDPGADKEGGKCVLNPPTALPVPAASGPRVFAVHPPTRAPQKACKEFKPEDVQ